MDEDERQLKSLLLGAGPRSPVPAADLVAIRTAARAAWLELVAAEQRRDQRRRARAGLALAASVLIALLLGWWTTRRTPGVAEWIASVERVAGDVQVRGDRGPAAAVSVGTRLTSNALLETSDGVGQSVGRLALRLTGGGSLRLDAGTRLRLAAERRFELERGALYFDSGGTPAAGSAVEIATAFGTVRDVGTQFEVRLADADQGVRVRVREGRVSVDGDGIVHSAVGGEELRVGRNGSVVRSSVASHGPEWDWVWAAAPGFDIEGRSLAAFLEWIGREEGWRVRYQSPDLEAAAASIRLHGSIEGLTPEESVSVVLPGSGLAYRLEGGTLVVSRPQNS